MLTSIKDECAIVGIGMTEISKNSGRSELQLAAECVSEAIADAGLILLLHSGDDLAFIGDHRCMPSTMLEIQKRFPHITMVLSHLGARIAVVDVSAYRLNLAKEMGAGFLINATNCDVKAALREANDDGPPRKAVLATGNEKALSQAIRTFQLIETHTLEPKHGGYLEALSRWWERTEDVRLSKKDLNAPKNMNTHLHVLEAYTNLLRTWPDPHLRDKLASLVSLFLETILNTTTHHLYMFFDMDWTPVTELISFGHDIEASWLLWEAAQILGDSALLAQVRESAINMAASVYRKGLDDDGSLFYEGSPRGLVDTGKAWWAQAEAVVGFYNAYQLTGQVDFAQAAYQCWKYIQAKMVDRTHGDWFKRLHRDGTPDNAVYKAGPWECPYHHSRTCFEMLVRLDH